MMIHADIERELQRPSRLSRLMVLVATLGVAIIAVWVLVPIFLTTYVARTTLATPAKTGPRTEERATLPATVLAATPASAAAAAPADAGSLSSSDDAVEPSEPDTTATVASTTPDTSVAAAMPWPSEPPMTAPSRPAPAQALQFAAAPPAPADVTVTVPLPRSRPGRMIAARLAIPLPRPRPDIANDAPSAEQAAFERDVQRMR